MTKGESKKPDEKIAFYVRKTLMKSILGQKIFHFDKGAQNAKKEQKKKASQDRSD